MRTRLGSLCGFGLGCAIALAVAGGSLAWAVPAAGPAANGAAVCVGGGALGTITITDKMIEPASASNPSVLKAAQRCSLTKQAEDDGWRINLVAHLNRPPGADEVNIVFYDLLPKPGPREAVQAYPIRTKKDGKIMMATLEIKPEDGFKAGSKYTVLITRLINGREDVYARTTLELK